MMLRIEDFPEPLFPISRTFCFLTFLNCWPRVAVVSPPPPPAAVGAAATPSLTVPDVVVAVAALSTSDMGMLIKNLRLRGGRGCVVFLTRPSLGGL